MAGEFRPAVGVVGANRFGICMAELAARNGHDVVLFTSIPQRAASLRRYRRLAKKVPELERLDERVVVTTDVQELAERTSLVICTMSREYLGRLMDRLSGALDGAHFVVHAVHTLEGPELERASEIIRRHTCVKQVGAIAGPAHVNELLAGKANAAVVGSSFPAVVRSVRRALGSPTFRIHSDPDMRGVELAAALGQVVAIAVGMADGAQMGAAAHATVLTRGLHEITEVGRRLGADERTFFGLAGIGRLVDALRRGEPNYQVGFDIGAGAAPEAVISESPGEALGVRVIWQIGEFAARYSLELPICTALGTILDGEADVTETLEAALRQDDVG